MYDVEEQSRISRWNVEQKSRSDVREMVKLAALPHQRSPIETAPPPPVAR